MPHEPRPRLTMVDTAVGADGEPRSLITRIWSRRAASTCSLCPGCSARPMLLALLCTVATPGFVGSEEAATHRFDLEGGDEAVWSNGGETLWAELVEDEA
ncbi:hypothetical protein [Planctomyces sp. SH-PL62]|uniref:hypothetical protein n=1 Tax=Planctomyces sp. SH-PL62 TaxID=1636152 RepID=UPI00078D0B76|nr:hypothetical protein [Planctomyces sp. SH-PL62]AMV38415.1 hypothetical protein VT85_13340 [Planctomyces sp. SH-PL62]